MVRSEGGQRESDGVVVPVIGVRDAPGGKGPGFDHACGEGKRSYLHRWPSRKAMKRLREKVRNRTGRNRVGTDIRVVIADVNPILRAGQADQWNEDWFNGHGLHRLRGTIRYPRAA